MMEQMKILAVLALSLGVLGCWGTDRELYVEHEFSLEERRIIESAADEWGAAADTEEAHYIYSGIFRGNSDFDFDRDYAGSHEHAAIIKSSQDEPGFNELYDDVAADQGGGEFCGIANVDYGRIVVTTECIRGLTSPEFRSVVMHELGHLLGLHDGDGRIMSDEMSPDCVDRESLELLCGILECGPNAHPTCE